MCNVECYRLSNAHLSTHTNTANMNHSIFCYFYDVFEYLFTLLIFTNTRIEQLVCFTFKRFFRSFSQYYTNL